jgi:LysM repeat protein
MIKKTTLVLLALFMALGMVAAAFRPAAAAEQVNCKQWHTVQGGEYLASIGKIYGVDWRVLAEINNLKDPNIIYSRQRICVSAPGVVSNSPVVYPPAIVISDANESDRVYAQSVKEDESVTLRGKSLFSNTRYYITMSNYRAKLAVPIPVGSVVTTSSGTFEVTFDIPKKLIDVIKIKVTIFSGAGDTRSNWFINSTLKNNTGGVDSSDLRLDIRSVDKGDWVKIRVRNMPTNVTFNVYMSREGNKGEKGRIKVGTMRGDSDGTVDGTFDIPDDLADNSKIDIRVENEPLGLSVYETFKNK